MKSYAMLKEFALMAHVKKTKTTHSTHVITSGFESNSSLKQGIKERRVSESFVKKAAKTMELV